MNGLVALQVAMTVQVLLGVARFGAGLVGFAIPPAVWLVHPVLGVVIAAAALVLLRPRAGERHTGVRLAARVAPLAPLVLGGAMRLGVAGGVPVVVAHIVLGLGAIKLLDTVIKQDLTVVRARQLPAIGAPSPSRP